MNDVGRIPQLQESAFEDMLCAQPTAVVEFFAPWCTPCEKMHGCFSELASEMGDRIGFFRVNVDECSALVERLNVVTLPTVVTYGGGRELARTTGPKAKHVLRALIENET